ncbi:MAG: glycoside hydrolase family 127 protein [Bacteroidales bacterium]|nr:glycoside hydrolase family 127 protein [Bacteroidales bacterium]
MKTNLVKTTTLLLAGLSVISFYPEKPVTGTYPIQPVPFTSVKITDRFWAPRIKTNHEVTIPIAIEQSTITGRIKNFEIAGGQAEGSFCSQYPFDDTDIYKIIEAASYSLQTFPDARLEAVLDTLILKIGAAQEEDGYLYTNRTIAEKTGTRAHEWAGSKRWEKVNELSHELYNQGHLYEAAVAHYRATGKRTLLDIAIKSANLIDSVFGWGKIEDYPGHQVVELGLVKLYSVTGEQRYLDLAKFFLDVRGPDGSDYNQANAKVTDQTEGVGHAVRATYMYTAMADIAAIYNDPSYVHAIRKIWEDIVHKKIYITGGIGASGGNEGFQQPYHLPNMSAYCETCASVGNIMWNQRMFLYDGDAKYMDILERTLYNALLSGVSLSGDRFFYPNVLESMGQHERSKWFGCACCPPNVARLLPSLPGYVYARSDQGIYVNLFIDNTAHIDYNGEVVGIIQKTDYPWDGKVEIIVNPEKSGTFSLFVRIPGWAGNIAMPGDLYSFMDSPDKKTGFMLNDKSINPDIIKGYAVLNRKWNAGDRLTIDLPMDVHKIYADERVTEDKDKYAVQRGPIVYCAEWLDQKDGHVLNMVFDKDAEWKVGFEKDSLNGVGLLYSEARHAKRTLEDKITLSDKETVTLIPYYAWNNRGPGEMMVWLPYSTESSNPLPAPTIANRSKVTGSRESKALVALNDQYEPSGSGDHTRPFYHWWPKQDTWEWVQYDFEKPEKVSRVRVYWFDDDPYGGCRVPEKWELLYKSGDTWNPVSPLVPYQVTKDAWDEIEFEPVITDGLRLRIKLQKSFSGGIHEWVVN